MKRLIPIAALSLVLLGTLFAPAAPASAGSSSGPESDAGRLAVCGDRVYEITFDGGELAQVSALGEGGDLDLYVLDEFGEVVDLDEESDNIPVCTWTPRRTATYTVILRNAHPQESAWFELETN